MCNVDIFFKNKGNISEFLIYVIFRELGNLLPPRLRGRGGGGGA